MTTLAPQYDPHAHEEQIYRQWEEAQAFTPSKTAPGKPFVIMLPPPNITGSLHMGHALQDTIMDILARYHRMKGEPTLWLPGTDHAALPTNKIIEKQLAQEGKTRHDIGREAFLARTEDWYAKTGAEILHQMKRLGASCDWSRLRFTLDAPYVQAVQEAFIRYYQAGYIYRGARIVNWDPATQTTVSDLEIDWQTETTPLYTFQYGPFQIATARPETKFGDKYVVMHPDDKRYAQYTHGDTFSAEWINGPVAATVIKDESVDPAFGTGVMTITPWHDAADFAIAKRHNLAMEQIIDFDGKLMAIAGEFAGEVAFAARPHIIEKLTNKGLLVATDENYSHNVAINDRGKGVIEPQVMRQWFVDMQKLKGETIAVAVEDKVKFLPPRWKKHFTAWMANVLDWNINRQIWLGHRLPVWWKPGTHGTDSEEGNYVVSIEKPGENALPADLSAEALAKVEASGEGWQQDPDVLDTWFSSALWPFATLGWPENTPDLQTFYPTSVLVTARDILYLWVARMIFSGLELTAGEEYGNRTVEARLPFHDIFIHPTVLAKNGQRMSKSLGTGIDPLELIDKYGADATRFGLMYQMSYDNQAIRFDEEAIKAARNFANKIWNLARLLEAMEEKSEGTSAEAWIENQLDAVARKISLDIEQYHFGEAAKSLHEFIWHDFADWYVEILKTQGDTAVARSVFRHSLQLLHPFMPHITEALWPKFGGKQLLIFGPWPLSETTSPPDKSLHRTRSGGEAGGLIQRFQDIVASVRSLRVLLELTPNEPITLAVNAAPLPKPLAALTRASLLDAREADMKDFVTPGGEKISLGAAALTREQIQRISDRLTEQIAAVQARLQSHENILAKMQGRAPTEKIAQKTALIAQEKQSLAELAAVQNALR